ncbi:MAG: ABC transporter substrate-binding protein [Chloroflexota bacterium]
MTQHHVSRRTFLSLLGISGSAALIAACQSTPPAASPTAAKPAVAPTTAPAQAAPKTEAPPVGKPAGETKSATADWKQQWDALVDAAKKEGTVVVSGPPTQAVRNDLPKAFKDRFGIELEYLGGRSGDLMTRLKSERSAGQYTLDAMIAGATTLYTQAYPEKMIDPIRPQLFTPEATEGSNWQRGNLWFMDPEDQYLLRLSNQVTLVLSINTQLVQPSEITSWKSLLEPKFKGKISVYDPTVSGPGSANGSYIIEALGDQYFQALYRDQEPGVSREERQLSDWLARGQYPITLGLNAAELEPLKSDGFPVHVVRGLPEAAGTVSAGFGLLALINKPAHPNAAKLFINWMAGKEGGETYNKAQVSVSNRTDIDSSWVPDYSIPQAGVNYFDIYSWEFTSRERSPEALDRIKRLIAKS